MCVPYCWQERCLVGMQEPGPSAPGCDAYKPQHGGRDRSSEEEEAQRLPDTGASMGFEPRSLWQTPAHFSSLCSRAPPQEAFRDYPGPQSTEPPARRAPTALSCKWLVDRLPSMHTHEGQTLGFLLVPVLTARVPGWPSSPAG